MMQYKTIRLSKSVLSDLKGLQKDGESIPEDVLDEISWIPQHPDEIFNTTMFTLISIEKALMEWNR